MCADPGLCWEEQAALRTAFGISPIIPRTLGTGIQAWSVWDRTEILA